LIPRCIMSIDTQIGCLTVLQHQMETTLDNMWDCSNLLDNFTSDRQGDLHQQITALLQNLRQLDQIAQSLGIAVPLNIVDQLDHNQNPDVVTKEMLSALRARNEQTRGRVFSTKILADGLESYTIHWKTSYEVLKDQTASACHAQTSPNSQLALAASVNSAVSSTVHPLPALSTVFTSSQTSNDDSIAIV